MGSHAWFLPLFLFFQFYIFTFIVWISCLHACLFAMCVSGGQGGHQISRNGSYRCIGAGNQTRDLCKSSQYSTSGPALQPCILHFYRHVAQKDLCFRKITLAVWKINNSFSSQKKIKCINRTPTKTIKRSIFPGPLGQRQDLEYRLSGKQPGSPMANVGSLASGNCMTIHNQLPVTYFSNFFVLTNLLEGESQIQQETVSWWPHLF